VIIMKSGLTFTEYRDVIHTVEGIEGVVAATPFVFLELRIASAGHAPIGFAMKGIDPQGVGRVLDLEPMLKVGKISDLAQGEPSTLILGDALARSLGVHTGDRVTVTSSLEGQPSDQPPREVPFRVTGILHTDLEVYDEELAFAPLAAAQRIADRGDHVTGIAVKVKDIDRSDQIAKAIERALGGPPYVAMDWYELNRGLLGDHRP
jgi:lipoprotein-releasing system permease protein